MECKARLFRPWKSLAFVSGNGLFYACKSAFALGSLYMNHDNHLAELAACEAIVCDLDGTLYLDGTPFPESRPFLEKILNSGRKLFYFTNNTSKSRVSYLEKLQRLQFPVNDRTLITAADCTYHYLQTRNLGPNLYLIGNQDLADDFVRQGFNCLQQQDLHQGRTPDAIVLGFDTELTYEKIRTGYEWMIRGVPYIATHADLLCPMSHGTFIPDVGSFIEMFATATGGLRPEVMGKPTEHAVRAITARAACPVERIAFIGDRLYTDIRMAMNFNMVGVLVLSGETDAEMLARSSDHPKVVVGGIGELGDLL
jgi:HAD superfamily hydrolase (TIGR01450 family)